MTLSHHDKRELHRVTGGVPIGIGFAVGMLANGALLDEVFDQLTQPKGEIARFCFESSVRSLKGTTANQMLMAFALFPASVSRDALMAIAVADPNSDSDSEPSQQRRCLKYGVERCVERCDRPTARILPDPIHRKRSVSDAAADARVCHVASQIQSR